MADDYDDEDMVPRSQIKALEEKAKKAGELETRLAEMERRSAFLEAGVSPSDPRAKYFTKGYDGELTTEAIRAEAEAAGLFAPSGQDTTDQQTQQRNDPTPQEMAAHARMAAASEGSGGAKPVDLLEAFGPRGSKKPAEIIDMARAAGLRMAEDQ